jgi:hypothetical protein
VAVVLQVVCSHFLTRLLLCLQMVPLESVAAAPAERVPQHHIQVVQVVALMVNPEAVAVVLRDIQVQVVVAEWEILVVLREIVALVVPVAVVAVVGRYMDQATTTTAMAVKVVVLTI